MTNYDKVIEFHEHFQCQIGKLGHLPTAETALLRVRLMNEELAEVVEAMQSGRYVDVAKELADLLYVVYGAAMAFGIPMDEVFDAVHTSNMTKCTERDDGGKITKGDNYEPPDIGMVLDAVLRREATDGNDVG